MCMVFFTEPIRRPWRSPNRQQRGISEKKFGVFYRGNENRVRKLPKIVEVWAGIRRIAVS